MLLSMRLFLDSFWRALAYCLMPRVIALSLVPLALLLASVLGWGFFYWEPTQVWVRELLESWQVLQAMLNWMNTLGVPDLQVVLVPLLVIFTVTPLLVLLSLLAVSLMMTPALVNFVVQRRFAHLAQKKGGSLWSSLGWTLLSTVIAVIAMLVTLPLWAVSPLMFFIPPLIWGWLGYRIMVYDALATHASLDERMVLMGRHRPWLLLIGVITGYLGGLPSLVWASGSLFAAAFVVLVPLAIWIYAGVFAFSSLWFTHYSLAALEALRAESGSVVAGASTPLHGLASVDDPSHPSDHRPPSAP